VEQTDYKPIESYGIIGDMHTVALIGTDGSIDWCCLPAFDSPSLFAAILDARKGGHFRIASLLEGQRKQMYLPDTNVLVTRFLSTDGVGEVVDFMPIHDPSVGRKVHEIVRVVRGVRGRVRFRLECRPAFDYARKDHDATAIDRGVVFTCGERRVALLGRIPLSIEGGAAIADFELGPDESATFVLRDVEPGCDIPLEKGLHDGGEALARTVKFWRGWLSRCTYHGRWREMIMRSALVLKMLTYQPTGAIVAAPTTSLPEEIGGVRNWDYRFTWIRDAAFTVYAFLKLGFTEEAAAFMDWLEKRALEGAGERPLQLMYGIDGRKELTELTLDHLDGYRGSRPVRIGNGAADQLQLDIYGELIDSVHIYNSSGAPISYDLWGHLRAMIDWVSRNWDRPDDGIWEVRGGPQQFTYSKMQCWVALDRGLKIAQARSFPIDRDRIEQERDRIFETTMTRGYDKKRRTFVQYFGTDALDASTLLMPLVHFVAGKDPRMLGTLEAIQKELVSDSLVYRYEIGKGAGDGLSGGEGTFNMCTFWLVEALTRAGKLDDARFIFEKMLTYANHLGLYAEETGPCGEALGNYPQAFTHMGLISAAWKLDRKLGRGV
jgi:GH15 family glucan-1,4-alpha-glucosidase